MPPIPATGTIIATRSSFNPCSGNGSPAQLLLNGTIFLICDPSVPFPGEMNEEQKLALGLGLGLGIPAFFGLVFLVRWWNIRRQIANLPQYGSPV